MYEGRNTTVVIARFSSILWRVYDVIWSNLEFPSFNFNSILDRFCILKRMSYMMPLSRHVLSLQTGLHRWFILGTVIPPTPFLMIPTELWSPWKDLSNDVCTLRGFHVRVGKQKHGKFRFSSPRAHMKAGMPPLWSPEFAVFYEGFTTWFGALWNSQVLTSIVS